MLQSKKTIEAPKPVRVLQVLGGMNRGGAETMMMHLYRNIDRASLQFDFISFTQDKCHYDDEIKALGGRIFYIPPPKAANPIKFVIDMYKTIKLYGPYHAVHAHTLFNSGFALLAARLAGVKVRVCHSHTTGNFNYSLSKKPYLILMRILIKICANKNKFK